MSEKNKLENGRAEKAFEFVKRGKDTPKSGEYKAWAKKIPSMIQMNGFGQTVAFLYSKKEKDPYKIFYTQISDWLKEKKFIDKNQELVDEICKVDSAKYRLMATETLALFSWLRRFAEGMIEDKKLTEEVK